MNKPVPRIRLLTVNDAADFHALRIEALRQYPEAFYRTPEEEERKPLKDVEDRLNSMDDRNFILGAFDDESIVGMVGFFQQTAIKGRHKGHVWGTYVKPEYHGRGIAKQLMQRLIDAAKKIPELEQITLTVVTENKAARRLYDKLGFQCYGTEPRALKLGERALDEDLMVLFL